MFGASPGFLWLLVFSDNPWPVPADKVLSILLVLTFLILWIALIVLGYMIGKRLEAHLALNRKHVLLSAGLTAMFFLFITENQEAFISS